MTFSLLLRKHVVSTEFDIKVKEDYDVLDLESVASGTAEMFLKLSFSLSFKKAKYNVSYTNTPLLACSHLHSILVEGELWLSLFQESLRNG